MGEKPLKIKTSESPLGVIWKVGEQHGYIHEFVKEHLSYEDIELNSISLCTYVN